MGDGGRIVVDSSVAMKWFYAEGEADVPEALALLQRHVVSGVVLCAPAHLLLEVANALRFRGLTAGRITQAVEALLGLGLELAPIERLVARAAVIALAHDLTVYDAAFAALAEQLDAELVTADRRLAESGACRARLL
jgi:predicted nucleic acid-binding protein